MSNLIVKANNASVNAYQRLKDYLNSHGFECIEISNGNYESCKKCAYNTKQNNCYEFIGNCNGTDKYEEVLIFEGMEFKDDDGNWKIIK